MLITANRPGPLAALAPWRRRSGRVGLAMLLLLVAIALYAMAFPELHLGNAALQPPSLRHPFGTDDLGRDMLIEIAQGVGPSILVGGVATLTALAIGAIAGLIAANGSMLVDDLVMRAAELTATIPPLLLAIVLGALFGNGAVLTAIILGVSFWPMVARVVRAAAFALRGEAFVLSAIALGRSYGSIAVHHILPGVLPIALSMSGIIFGGAVLAEATLAFVGLGDPTVTTWGQTIAHAGGFMHVAWWLWLFPGLALVAACVGVGLLTDMAHAQ
jgi:peptide/nickel transport system permease protein